MRWETFGGCLREIVAPNPISTFCPLLPAAGRLPIAASDRHKGRTGFETA